PRTPRFPYTTLFRSWATTVSGLITSRDNERLKLVRRLASRHEREKTGLFVCEGEDLVEAAQAAGVDPFDLLVAGVDVEKRLLARSEEHTSELQSLRH